MGVIIYLGHNKREVVRYGYDVLGRYSGIYISCDHFACGHPSYFLIG